MDGSIYHYWGKAAAQAAGPAAFHLLPYHSLDVAAVGYVYLREAIGVSRLFTERLCCDESEWLSWASFWLAMHDIGKFSEAFQSQRPDIFQSLHGRVPSPDKPYVTRHDSLGQWIWKGALSAQAERDSWFGADTRRARHGLDAWMRAVTGHHGQPPMAGGAHHLHFSRVDEGAVNSFASQLRPLLLTDAAATIPARFSAKDFEHCSRALSWWFAGVAVQADWLGSNTDYFPYVDKPTSLEEYWRAAQSRAETALHAAELLPVRAAMGKTLADLFPHIESPSPLQAWASSVPIEAGAQLHILEDVTGAGKTEAAVLLAYRLLEAGLADGFFIGLPTMATANAMYERISGVYRRLYAESPSLTLTHGSRNLVEQFARSVLPPCESEQDRAQADETASARCSAWLADHGKRALLASAGVGTIDQALLAVLHSRHQSLRLLGLVRKVLVIDEVHACDAYMQKVLEVLLEFHARAGGSAILLSATLAERMKTALLGAFVRGRGAAASDSLASPAYPLVSSWHEARPGSATLQPLDSRAEVCRTVAVHYRSCLDDVLRAIRESLAAGQCVCWVRNTVHDAIAAMDFFGGKEGGQILLFHARFALADRLDREKEILHRFGRDSGPGQRRGRLVIATQVIEQSLDVDFDLLVSDLAPVDRLIQRAGRMHRHTRDAQGQRLQGNAGPDGRGQPRLIVYGPEFSVAPPVDWYRAVFSKAASVYPDHAQLWRTARELQTGSFSMPADARRLVETVFSADEADVPQTLRQNAARALGIQLADAGIAQANSLRHATGYERGDVVDWWSDARTPSRLGEASQSVVLARWQGNRLLPWVDREQAWSYSTVRVPMRLIQYVEPAKGSRLQEYERARQSLPAEGRWSVLLGLEQTDAGGWIGMALPAAHTGRPAPSAQRWRYDSMLGLRVEQELPGSMEGE